MSRLFWSDDWIRDGDPRDDRPTRLGRRRAIDHRQRGYSPSDIRDTWMFLIPTPIENQRR